MSTDRRQFLRRAVAGTVLGTTGLSAVTGSAVAAEEMTISGTLQEASGDPAAHDGIRFSNAWDGRNSFGTGTAADGSFQVTVPEDRVEQITNFNQERRQILYVGYYEFPHAKDSNPDVYALTHVDVESGADLDLGVLELPEGLKFDVRVIQRGQGPVEGATVRAASQYTGRGTREFNWGRGDATTSERGLMDWDGLPEPGMEMADLVHLWIWPPDSAPSDGPPAVDTHVNLQRNRHMETVVI